jgi:site-specific DNA-methyltransferase (adenine-specific)
MLKEYENIKLYHGDCMDLMRETPDKFYDIAIVDPPYFKNVATKYFFGKNRKSVIKHSSNLWNDNIPTKDYYNELKRISKNQIIWGINYFDFGFVGSGRIIWDKKNDNSTFSKAEIASCSLINSTQIFRFLWNGFLQENMKDKYVTNHPTGKPPALYEYLLKNYVNQGDKILDTHLGSGSIAIAIDKANIINNMNLQFTGIEIDEDYFNDMIKRFENYKSQLTLTLI